MSKLIDDLSPLRDVIREHHLRAEKKLGQNFLLDLNLTDKITRAAGDLSGCTVFEIGPGPGGLTRSLLKSNAQKVIAIEYDERAIAALQSLREAAAGRLEIIHGDALTQDLLSLAPAPRAIVANLPYNIATPLLIGWLRQIREVPEAFRHLTLMFQKEVAQRLTAPCSVSAYGRLSVISQWLCECQMMFDLPPSAFTPPPKVVSSVVHLIPRPLLPMGSPRFELVEKVTQAAFGQRRKMIRSSLKAYSPYIEKTGLDFQARAEDLTVADFVQIASFLPQS